MHNVLQAIKVICGLLLVIGPFTSRFRRETSRWVQIAVPIAGALTLVHVVFSSYIEGLRIAGNPQYWHTLRHQGFLGGIVCGILLSFLLQLVIDRISKTRGA